MLRYHATGLGWIVVAIILALEHDYGIAAMALWCAYSHAKGGKTT